MGEVKRLCTWRNTLHKVKFYAFFEKNNTLGWGQLYSFVMKTVLLDEIDGTSFSCKIIPSGKNRWYSFILNKVLFDKDRGYVLIEKVIRLDNSISTTFFMSNVPFIKKISYAFIEKGLPWSFIIEQVLFDKKIDTA